MCGGLLRCCEPPSGGLLTSWYCWGHAEQSVSPPEATEASQATIQHNNRWSCSTVAVNNCVQSAAGELQGVDIPLAQPTAGNLWRNVALLVDLMLYFSVDTSVLTLLGRIMQ
jgi:hypothetical protein